MAALSIAYLGPPASYTHQAAKSHFPSSSHTLVPCTTIPDIFIAVQNGTAERGVVPFENSTYGPVLTTLDLFASSLKGEQAKPASTIALYNEIRPRTSGVEVCGEAFVKVRHFLLGHRRRQAATQQIPLQSQQPSQPHSGPVIPSTTIQPSTTTPHTAQSAPHSQPHLPPLCHITRVLSHEQALGQCKSFLSTSLPHAEKKVVSSTSKAAELAAADETGETAAVCSELAAEVYGLDVLREAIQDRDDNVTRFMVLRRSGSHRQEGIECETDGRNGLRPEQEKDGARFKALVLFTVDHTSPGALADSLAVFKTHGLNLTSINTRPSGARPWNYFFFVEVEGRCGEEERLEKSLDELGKVTVDSRCLGSWEVVS